MITKCVLSNGDSISYHEGSETGILRQEFHCCSSDLEGPVGSRRVDKIKGVRNADWLFEMTGAKRSYKYDEESGTWEEQ